MPGENKKIPVVRKKDQKLLDQLREIDKNFSHKLIEAIVSEHDRRQHRSNKDFIEHSASGTLRGLSALATAHHSMLITERVAHAFGYACEAVPLSCLTYGPAIIASDVPAYSDVLKHYKRLQARELYGTKISIHHLAIRSAAGKGGDDDIDDGEAYTPKEKREGVGLIFNLATRPDWLPESHVVIALTSEWNSEKHKFLPTQNPG